MPNQPGNDVEPIGVVIPRPLLTAVDSRAAKENNTRSEFVRRALMNSLSEAERQSVREMIDRAERAAAKGDVLWRPLMHVPEFEAYPKSEQRRVAVLWQAMEIIDSAPNTSRGAKAAHKFGVEEGIKGFSVANLTKRFNAWLETGRDWRVLLNRSRYPELQEKRNTLIVPKEIKKAAKAKRSRLRDIDTVSLQIFGNIPAGWPQPAETNHDTIRQIKVRQGRFPIGAFGLEVRGESMNAATPEPILNGAVVVLLPPEQREPRHNDIVAALCDGQTTLKRLICPKDQTCSLHAESTNPAFARDIKPAHDLTIQGVVIGKL